MSAISIVETFEGKHVLITGASGFVGKVWLAMALSRVPNIGKIYVLLRGKGRRPVERFEKLVNDSMAFCKLHEQHGPELSRFISERVHVVDGDVSKPHMGIDPSEAEELHKNVDLVINCAGLVDFNPDLRDAVSSNVDGAVHAADFVEACDHASLIHVSTCYVAGERDGFIRERLEDCSPNGTIFDPLEEYAYLDQLLGEVEAENESAKAQKELRDVVAEKLKARGHSVSEKRLLDMVGRLKQKRLRDKMADAGRNRARELGWPNTYTYTKAMAEYLLRTRKDRLNYSVLRPAIVESSESFPFPGWNEGFNTSGPLVYLAGTWFRHVPAEPDNPLDVIPVDAICEGLFVAGAALMRREARPVYQCGSSHRNPLSMERLTELSALGHRKFLRREHNKFDRIVMSRWDARATKPDHVFKVTNILETVKQIRRYLEKGLPEKIPSEVREWADDLSDTAKKTERKLKQVDDIVDIFIPFTHDTYLIFETVALSSHDVVEPEFRFRPEDYNWRRYWVDVHVPGLKKWCFPKYENKDIPTNTPAFPFQLLDLEDAAQLPSRPTEDATASARA